MPNSIAEPRNLRFFYIIANTIRGEHGFCQLFALGSNKSPEVIPGFCLIDSAMFLQCLDHKLRRTGGGNIITICVDDADFRVGTFERIVMLRGID